MNKKIFFLIVATAIISSFVTSRGRFLYYKVMNQHAIKDKNCNISEIAKVSKNNSVYEVLAPSPQNGINSATKSNDIVFSGTLEKVQQYFESKGWTNGLPIIPPTQELVSKFYQYTPYAQNDVLAKIPPANRQVMTKHVAVVGAMAGCPPEYMPILVAFTKAIMNDDFRKTLSNIHAWTPFLWLNGPIARQLKIGAGQGAISSPNNKKIARFIDLAMINFSNADEKKNRIGALGVLSSLAMAENEEAVARIGWQPYHVQQGFNVNDSTITVATFFNWGNPLTPATNNAEQIVELMAWDSVEKGQFALGSGISCIHRTIFITESVAKELSTKYTDKKSLEEALIQKARRPLEERVYANYWANPTSSFDSATYSIEQHKAKIATEEKAELTPIPNWLSWIQQDKIQTIPVMTNDKTAIIIAGDSNKKNILTVPGSGMITIKIELPNNWNVLVKKLGYREITFYYYKTGQKITYPIKTNTIIKKNIPTQQKNRVFIQPNGKSVMRQQYKRVYRKPTTKQYRRVRRVIRVF